MGSTSIRLADWILATGTGVAPHSVLNKSQFMMGHRIWCNTGSRLRAHTVQPLSPPVKFLTEEKLLNPTSQPHASPDWLTLAIVRVFNLREILFRLSSLHVYGFEAGFPLNIFFFFLSYNLFLLGVLFLGLLVPTLNGKWKMSDPFSGPQDQRAISTGHRTGTSSPTVDGRPNQRQIVFSHLYIFLVSSSSN